MSAGVSRQPEAGAKPDRTCVLILGMHRSGTSMLTGTLGHLGCRNANTLMPANAFNEAGYYESAPVSHLNDNLLISAGSTWDDWRPVDPAWFSSGAASGFLDKAGAVLDDEFGDAPLFSLKDPRICRLLPFWLEVFRIKGITPVALHIHRNPVNVAASLQNRDDLSPDYSHILWLHNMLDAEAGSRGLKRFFTTYSQVLADWERVVDAAAQTLEITWPTKPEAARKDIQNFIQPRLMHFNDELSIPDNPPVSDWVKETYDIFTRWTQGDETAPDRTRLTAIREQMDKTLAPFSGILDAALSAARARNSTASELTRTKAQHSKHLDEMEGRLEQSKAAAAYWKARTAELAEQVEQLKLDALATKSEAELRAAGLKDQLEQLRKDTEARMSHIRDRTEAEMAGLRASNMKLQDKMTAHQQAQQAQIRHLQAAFEEARFTTEMMRSSTSWRVTAPLRRFKSKLQG